LGAIADFFLYALYTFMIEFFSKGIFVIH